MESMKELEVGEALKIGDVVLIGHEGLEQAYTVTKVNPELSVAHSFEGRKVYVPTYYGEKSSVVYVTKKRTKVYRKNART